MTKGWTAPPPSWSHFCSLALIHGMRNTHTRSMKALTRSWPLEWTKPEVKSFHGSRCWNLSPVPLHTPKPSPVTFLGLLYRFSSFCSNTLSPALLHLPEATKASQALSPSLQIHCCSRSTTAYLLSSPPSDPLQGSLTRDAVLTPGLQVLVQCLLHRTSQNLNGYL